MTSAADSITKREYFRIFLICVLFMFLPAVLTHVRTGHEEKQNEQDELDAYCLPGKNDLSAWTKYVMQYKNPRDFLYPNEKEGFSFFRYQQNDAMQDILPEYRPVYVTAFAKPGMKEQPPAIVMPDFPKPELYAASRVPVYPDLPAVQYPAVFSSDGKYLAHPEFDLSKFRDRREPLVFTVVTPQLPDLPRYVYLDTPTDNLQMNQDLISYLNQKLLAPDFLFQGEKLLLYFTPPESTNGEAQK